MARLVSEMIEKRSRRIWLDQHQITRSTEPKEVTKRIGQTFLTVSQIIILAAPGDWDRFSNMDDIHRWEWEMSLRSGKSTRYLDYSRGLGANSAKLRQAGLAFAIRNVRQRTTTVQGTASYGNGDTLSNASKIVYEQGCAHTILVHGQHRHGS